MKFTTFLLAFLLATFALAQERATRELVRDLDSDVEYEAEYQIEEMEGGVHVSGAIHIPNAVGAIKKSIELTIDPKAGTFKLKKLPLSAQLSEWSHIEPAFEEDEGLVHRHDANTTIDEKAQVVTRPGGMDLSEPPDGCPCEGQECIGSINAWIYTRDNPAQSNLTKTSVVGGWKRYVNNSLICRWVGLPSVGGCVAAAPSSMGTNWYRNFFSPCTVSSAIVSSGPGGRPGHWEKAARGGFYNKDYGSIYLQTDSSTIIRPTFQSGTVTIYHDEDKWGEGEERLVYAIDMSLNNSCNQ